MNSSAYLFYLDICLLLVLLGLVWNSLQEFKENRTISNFAILMLWGGITIANCIFIALG